MKKLILAAAVAALASSAMAADVTSGTVNFKGIVTDQTCTIQAGSENLTVDLGSVLASKMAEAGKFSTAVPFSIALTGCKTTGAVPAVTKVKARFFSDANVDSAHNYTLKNTATTTKAEKVNVQLLNKDLTPITPSKEGTIDVANNVVGIADGAAGEALTTPTPILHYAARMYATDVGATPGNVQSSVDFELAYE